MLHSPTRLLSNISANRLVISANINVKCGAERLVH
jgi:hypothetical protein